MIVSIRRTSNAIDSPIRSNPLGVDPENGGFADRFLQRFHDAVVGLESALAYLGQKILQMAMFDRFDLDGSA
ncbi:hypothetical protein [Halosolutus gelatinilyticus]|uniref:hypothetical protein n=1 Tax=Halosolutus gelatinilyticus TaxID=2931975 RepID=UPI001FF5673A|nr:hypothetical protein [Halosolutus gelatinilyticus]